MNTVNLSVNLKGSSEPISLVLFQKIYSTPYGIVNHWSTDSKSEYRLEIIIDEEDLSVNPQKVTKSLDIISEEWVIADQMMMKLLGSGNFNLQNETSFIKSNKIY